MSSPRVTLVRGLLRVSKLFATRHGIEDEARTLVVAPHPDDEVLGCGGTIARKAMAGAAVKVVIMTDGRTSHAHLIDVEQLIHLRRAEACAAARELGVDSSTYEFMNYPDGQLHEHRAAAVASMRKLITSFQPREIYVPHRDDRQVDHITTYQVVQAALQGLTHSVKVFEYPVWLRHSWPWTWGPERRRDEGHIRHFAAMFASVWQIAFGCRERYDISAVQGRKLAAIRAYGSQMERRDGNPRWPIMADVAGGEFMTYFTGSEEVFRMSVRHSTRG